MQRKPGFPVANCSIKMPDGLPVSDGVVEEEEPQQRRQQLINFGHAQWGFNNWSWSVTKQDLDFVELTNGKYTAGVVTFVSVNLKTINIHRENIGYATSIGPNKGSAIFRARKCAVTNALRETLLSFGGNVATELSELLEVHRPEIPAPELLQENNPAIANRVNIPNTANIPNAAKLPNATNMANAANIPNIANPNMATVPRPPEPKNQPRISPPVKNAPRPPAPRPLAPPPANAPRPNSNEVKLEGKDEEARAERKRKQKQAQEEFRMRHLMKNNIDEELNKDSSLDSLLMAIPTQDIVEGTGNTVEGKRKSTDLESGNNKRLNVSNKINNV